jgi:murein DD-endopeptidase MepM/ murein hydrolase activator NlpD
MRSEYKISRTRDGGLIVKQANRGRRVRGPVIVGFVTIVAAAFFSAQVASTLEFVSSIPGIFASLLSDVTHGTASRSRKTVTVKLPIEKTRGGSAPLVESLKPSIVPTKQELPTVEALAENLAEPTIGTVIQADTMPDDSGSRTMTRIELPETELASVAAEPVVQASEQVTVVEPKTAVVKVKSGDSLYTIFNDLGLSQGEMLRVTSGDGKQLTRIHPGQSLEFHVSESGELQALLYRIDEVNSLHFRKTASGFSSEQVVNPLDARVATSQGHIQSSLFLSGQSAGLSDRTIMSLVEIFGWDVDFALDIRRGDQFSVIYEELFKGDKKLRDGKILAAEFVNQGRRIRAVRYTDEDGRSNYFSPDGASMRKAFLRTPVNFSRISSHFNLKRKHPVLNTIRAHKGVDYAAPRGTPVKATGDGKIAHSGRKGGYGKALIIRHGSTYTTLYGHLKGYAKGMRAGTSVSQGQVIGYVGSTGLATGPHLHYEFRVRGVHRDPLKVELPKVAPISEHYRQDFVESTRALVLQLDYLSGTQIASGQLASQ